VTAVSAVVLIFYDLRNVGASRTFPRLAGLGPKMKSLARSTGVLGFIPLLVSLNGYLCRYWLAHFRSEAEVGVFSAIAYITVAANTVVMALGQAAGPAMARSYVNGEVRAFWRQSLRLALVGTLLGIGGILAAWQWGGPLLRLFYGAAYAMHSNAFLVLMAGGAVGYLAACAGYTLSSARCFLPQLPMLAVVAAAISVACWFLIPKYGIQGAALAQAIGYGVQLALSAVLLRIRRPIPVDYSVV
jgi:O-antigen/teichoic acid export membrane protein